jgi:hypothetical protein
LLTVSKSFMNVAKSMLWRMAIILKANKVNLFVSSVLFVFWYHSPNFLDTPRSLASICELWDVHSCVVESFLLGCDAATLGERFLKSWMTTIPPSSRVYIYPRRLPLMGRIDP